jgi:hypothetical protein
MPFKEHYQDHLFSDPVFSGEAWQFGRGDAGIQGRTIDFSQGLGVKSTLRVNKSSRKEVVVLNRCGRLKKIMVKVPERIGGQ